MKFSGSGGKEKELSRTVKVLKRIRYDHFHCLYLKCSLDETLQTNPTSNHFSTGACWWQVQVKSHVVKNQAKSSRKPQVQPNGKSLRSRIITLRKEALMIKHRQAHEGKSWWNLWWSVTFLYHTCRTQVWVKSQVFGPYQLWSPCHCRSTENFLSPAFHLWLNWTNPRLRFH